MTWDKYSFFLYLDGDYNEALMANEKALGIANVSGEKEWVNKIMEHRNQISSKSWKRY